MDSRRGGSRGGSLGFGLAGSCATSSSVPDIFLRTGGFGRLSVFRPVVFARYGTGGRVGTTSSSSSSSPDFFSSVYTVLFLTNGAPTLLSLGLFAVGVAVKSCWSIRFGGGSNVVGSLRLSNGVASCSRDLMAFLSLPLPIQPAFWYYISTKSKHQV